MKKLILVVVFAMAVGTTFAQKTTPDPTGQNRYEITTQTKPLSIFDIPKYDENDASFFDGWTSKTAEELGLVGQEFWNEFGKVARKGYVEKGAVFRIPNGFQWKEAYLEGCRVGPEKKVFYNRVWFPHKLIVEAIPDKPAPTPKVDPVPAPKAADPAPTANADQRLQDFKDGLLTGSLIAKSNNNCCCCGTQTTTTTLPQTTYPQVVLPQTVYPQQQVIYPQQPQVVYQQQTRGQRIWDGIIRTADAILPDVFSINVNNSTSVNSGNTQYSYPTTQTQYPQQQYPQQQYPQQPVITQSQNRCADGSMPVLWTYQDGSTQYICGGIGNTTNPGNGTVVTQQPQLPGNTNEPGSGQTPPIVILPGNTNEPAFQANGNGMNLRTVNNQTQGLNSNGSFMNQNQIQNQGLTSNGAFASGLQN